MTALPGTHLREVKNINDSREVFTALLRDHEELVTEVYGMRDRMRTLRHWARLWRMLARLERNKRKRAEEERESMRRERDAIWARYASRP